MRTRRGCPRRPGRVGNRSGQQPQGAEARGAVRGSRSRRSLGPSPPGPRLAFVRLRYPHGNYKPFHDLLVGMTEILEAHHVTGDDCFVLKVAARSMSDLEAVTGRIATLGSVTTSVVYSSPLRRRAVAP
ncbi:Lrp/AsnC ligand binding domain-containing protein [Streptomyces sp. NPDC059209]|uniref:Lrp/AsnC ligand binding domain-containing protein n=1 Tax=Streptomyces sp. NPDC059209 TaxID=3346769 RepID=UPI003691ADAF